MHRVADGELPRVDEAENVAGVRHVDRFAVAAEKAVRARRAQLLADAAVRQHHVFLETARADAHERHAIAVARIHVRLNLEDEAGEPLVGRRDNARIARPRRRRRRQIDERLQKRLEAEVRQRAAEEHRRLNAGQILLDVELRSGRADDVERLAKVRVHPLADHLREPPERRSTRYRRARDTAPAPRARTGAAF